MNKQEYKLPEETIKALEDNKMYLDSIFELAAEYITEKGLVKLRNAYSKWGEDLRYEDINDYNLSLKTLLDNKGAFLRSDAGEMVNEVIYIITQNNLLDKSKNEAYEHINLNLSNNKPIVLVILKSGE